MTSETMKTTRVLELYQSFLSGQTVNKQEAAERYHVNVRSIQRDIDSIRDFLSEQCAQQGIARTIEYDKKANGYRLISKEITHLSPGEVLAMCKIMLESKAFTREQVGNLLQAILELCVPPGQRADVERLLSNELFCYQNPAHREIDFDSLWKLSEAIRSQRIAELDYLRLKDQSVVKRRVKPVGLLFSEYYFYLLAFIDDANVRDDFEKKGDPYPTIYRVDRIQNLRISNEKFSVPYRDRFKEGEYKNRVQYMYGGEPQELVFEYYGPSIEAVLDRFPTAAVEEKDGVYTVTAEVFGNGVVMWLLSQGSKVKVLASEKLVRSISSEIKNLTERYSDAER